MKKDDILKLYVREQELYVKYHKYISPNNIGISCNFGWLPILEELFQYWDQIGADAKVVQIKEKFGDLRVYFDSQNMTNEQHDASWKIIDKSHGTCDICGEPGDTEGCTGWIVTRCAEHKNFNERTYDISYQEITKLVEPYENKLRKLIGERKPKESPWKAMMADIILPDGNVRIPLHNLKE